MKRPVIVAGQPMADRLMDQINNQGRRIEGPKPTVAQVAMVMHALADHTAIQQMLIYDPDFGGPWPRATSIGRFMHAVGDDLEDRLK